MNDLKKFAEAVRQWAASVPQVYEAYFVGSRVKGGWRETSDLDVAVTMIEPDGYGEWFFRVVDWEKDLQERLPVKVHLLRGGGTLKNEIVQLAIEDHGLKVYQRETR